MVENYAIEVANRALSVLEQLTITYTDLNSEVQNLTLNQRADFAPIMERFKSLIDILCENDSELPELVKFKELDLNYNSKIERLRLGKQIVELKNSGCGTKEIATRLNVDTKTISNFVRFYNSATPQEKIRIERRSVFDITNNLEELNRQIYRMLANIEHNPEVHVKYIGELRQVLKFAGDWMQRVSSNRKYEELKEVIISILADELPEKRALIITRLEKVGFSHTIGM